MDSQIYIIHFFVPEGYCELVKQSMFAAGAGNAYTGNYESCAWQVLGQGQFRSLKGSQPFIGEINADEYVQEYKVEMICDAKYIMKAIAALIHAHPYESPAYYVTPTIEVVI